MVTLWSCDIIFGNFSHTLVMLHALFRMRMGHFIGIPTSSVRICPQSGVGICAVLTAHAVVIGKVNFYNL